MWAEIVGVLVTNEVQKYLPSSRGLLSIQPKSFGSVHPLNLLHKIMIMMTDMRSYFAIVCLLTFSHVVAFLRRVMVSSKMPGNGFPPYPNATEIEKW